MKNKQTVLAACITLLPFYAQADVAPAMQCTVIKDDALRLACFDKVYSAQFPPAKPLPEAKPQEGKALDLVQTVNSSLENKDAVLVFSPPEKLAEEGFEPTQTLLDAADAYTPLSNMYDLDANDEDGLLTVREHNPMYLMPAWYNTTPNRHPHSPTRGISNAERFADQKRLEAKMQVSFKTKVAEDLFKTRADVWFGYTQKSDWQLWSQGHRSAPFRNSDYAPEMFITQPVKAELPFGGKLRMVGAGFIHESNGQSRPESRSWNRAYAMAGMEWGKLTVMPRVWTRLFDQKGDNDDNPDITKYMGHGDVRLHYRFNDRQALMSTLRYNPSSGKGAVEAGYSFPVKGKLKGYVRGFHGYGESLIDYNHKQTGIGIGLMFRDWDGI
ncbi:MAG: phospholipase A [Neisseria sp.]|nr:phospholipase A [Neisseria sp.]